METKITLSHEKPELPRVAKLERNFSKADVHFHHKNYAQQGADPQQLLGAMNDMRMEYTVLSPIPTNLLVQCGRCDTALHDLKPLTAAEKANLEKLWNGGVWSKAVWDEFDPAKGSSPINIINVPNYYISELNIRQSFQVDEQTYEQLVSRDGPLYYNTMVDDQTADSYLPLKDDDKQRFDPMVTGLVLGDMRCSEMLIDKLRRKPGVFTGVGEITVYKEWVQEKVGLNLQADMRSRAFALIKLMNTCGVIGMPVVLHCDVDVMPWDTRGDADAERPSPVAATLAGARLAVSSESKDGQRLDVALVKRHTGGGYMTARFMRENSFRFEITHKLWLMTNHRPALDHLDDAMRGRLHLIPFDMRWNRPGHPSRDPSVPDGDKDLMAKLREEAPGILAWLVRGAVAYHQHGLEPPAEVVRMTRDFFDEQDPLGRWIETMEPCEPRAGIGGGRLFETFRRWCDSEGESGGPHSQKAFSLELQRRGVAKLETSSAKLYGLRTACSGEFA